MDLLGKIDLYIGEEVVVGGAIPSTPGTTTSKIAKYPESGLMGRRKRKKFKDEIDKDK